MSFYFDIEDKRRILAKKLRKNNLKKLIADFLEPKYISMFGKVLWFAYKSSDKLEKVAK